MRVGPVLIAFQFFLILSVLGLTVAGLIYAFKASIILGLIVVVVEPAPFLIGLLALFGMSDLCARLAVWAHFPF